jgi:hypothetical protein
MQYMKVVFGSQEHALKFERSRAYCNLLAPAFPLMASSNQQQLKQENVHLSSPKN